MHDSPFCDQATRALQHWRLFKHPRNRRALRLTNLRDGNLI